LAGRPPGLVDDRAAGQVGDGPCHHASPTGVGFLIVGLLLTGTHALRMTPEVTYYDKGRQSVEVRVTEVSADPDAFVVRRQIGSCGLWFYVNP
jgi:hypothetical protein